MFSFKNNNINNCKNNDELTPKQKTNKEMKELIFSTFKALTVMLVIIIWVMQMGAVNGPSMEPTFHDGEKILIWKLDKEYERNDIIIFASKDDEYKNLIKRVIAVPGETVQIIDNDIYINNEKIKDVVDIDMQSYGIAAEPISLKDDEYFVLGDNRNHSIDSRDDTVGVVHKDLVKGKVVLRFYPWALF